MSRHAFDPECPDCRPILLDPQTGKILEESDPVMQAVIAVWRASPRADQEAFHAFTVKNSREPGVLERMMALSKRMEQAVSAAPKTPKASS
jgi:hypothetical protein